MTSRGEPGSGWKCDPPYGVRQAAVRAHDAFVGSGTVKSARLPIVAHRLKRSGAQRQLANASQTARGQGLPVTLAPGKPWPTYSTLSR